ncbi:MAG: filamentous hemagglutinin N-terminal domain-containing protein [Alphaproteobacteria bacterium]|nr:filamentous hemagglutinin N-terminal domain-containing protein [Alphaproteobacteria bacterium]
MTSDIFKYTTKITLLMTGLYASSLLHPAFALPNGGKVVAGEVTFRQLQDKIIITQTSEKAVIDWNNFSVAAKELVQFNITYNELGRYGATLNRVVGGKPSQIFGQIKSNGLVYFVNLNGAVFGDNVCNDCKGFYKLEFNVDNEIFMERTGAKYEYKNGRIILVDDGHKLPFSESKRDLGLVGNLFRDAN